MENYITDVKNAVRSLNAQLEIAMKEAPAALDPENSFNCIASHKEIKSMIKRLHKEPDMKLFLEIEDRILQFSKEAFVADKNNDHFVELIKKRDDYDEYESNCALMGEDKVKRSAALYLGLEDEYDPMPEVSRRLREQVYWIEDSFRNAFLSEKTAKQLDKTAKSIVRFEQTHEQADLMKAEKNIMLLYQVAFFEETLLSTGISKSGKITLRYSDYLNMGNTPEGLKVRGLRMLGVKTIEEARRKLGLND